MSATGCRRALGWEVAVKEYCGSLPNKEEDFKAERSKIRMRSSRANVEN